MVAVVLVVSLPALALTPGLCGVARLGATPATAGAGAARGVLPRLSMEVADDMVLFDAFVRNNARTDRFEVLGFHHVELYCSDAACTAGRFAHALGMDVLATSRNSQFASVAIGSGDVRLSFTAPLAAPSAGGGEGEAIGGLAETLGYTADAARAFLATHGGVAVRAICVRVADVRAAYAACVDGGGTGVLPPRDVWSEASGTSSGGGGGGGSAAVGALAEVALYGDVVLRLLSLDEHAFEGGHMPGYTDNDTASGSTGALAGGEVGGYGIVRFDHIVGNVWKLRPTVSRLRRMLGFHEFAGARKRHA